MVVFICIFSKVRLCSYVSLSFIRLLHSAFLDHLTDKFLFLFDGLELLAIHQLTGVASLPDLPAEELLAELASFAFHVLVVHHEALLLAPDGIATLREADVVLCSKQRIAQMFLLLALEGLQALGHLELLKVQFHAEASCLDLRLWLRRWLFLVLRGAGATVHLL